MKRALLGVLMVTWIPLGCAGSTESAPPPTAPPAPSPAPLPPPAPVAPPAPVEPAKPSMLDQQKAHMAANVAAWQAHDAKKLAALYADDVVLGFPSMEGWRETRGRADLEKNMAEFFAAFSDAKVTTLRGIHAGDVLVLEWLLSGTHSGDFMGAKPTGKRIGYRGVSVLWFGDKGVKREHMYFDHVTFMAQMGTAPKGMVGRPLMEVPAGHEPEWVVAANNDVEKKNAEAATAFYATWEKKDSKAFLDSLTEDAQHLDFSRPADGQKGKAAAKKDFDAFIKAFPDMKMNVKNMWAAGPYVVLESEATGTFKGALGPLKPTQKTGTLHGLDVMKLADGKLALGHSYGSGAEFAGAFGLMPKDAGKPPAKPAGGAKAPSTPLPPPGLPPAGGAKPGGGAKPTPPPAGGPKPPPPPGGAKPPAPGAKPPAAGAKPPAPVGAPKPPAPPAGAKPPAPPAPKPPAPKP